MKQLIKYYREIFNDYNTNYRHGADIIYKINQIKYKDINLLTDKEQELRLIIELEEVWLNKQLILK